MVPANASSQLSAVHTPSLVPESTSECFDSIKRGCATPPNSGAIDATSAHIDSCLPSMFVHPKNSPLTDLR